MPHSYGESFVGVGLNGLTNEKRPIAATGRIAAMSAK